VRAALPKVGAVTICSSSRFYETARRVAAELAARGVTVHTPRFDYNERHTEVGPEDKAWLTREFLDKVRQADLVYVVDEGGYTGTSVCIEVGYAAALGKTIVLSEPAIEHAVAALADEVVSVAELPTALRSGD
jgi:nucleoside 2-deoxyribosyltransferase